MTSFILVGSTPRVIASESPKESTFKRHRMSHKENKPNIVIKTSGRMFCQVIPVRLPNSQNVIAGKVSKGSATYFNSEVKELKRDPIKMPINVSTSKGDVLYMRLPKKDRNTASNPNKKAEIWTSQGSATNNSANAAPNPAPEVTPRIFESTRGFLNIAWNPVPVAP
ncbi:MAG: hypothetical protein R6T96_13190 [Longimicrobiales bacterium]